MAFLSEVFLSCHFSFLLLCLLPPLRAWRAVSLFQIARQCTFIRGGYELRRASSHTEQAPVASSDIGGDMPSCRLLCRSKRIRQEQSARLYCHSCAFITSRKSWQMINPHRSAPICAIHQVMLIPAVKLCLHSHNSLYQGDLLPGSLRCSHRHLISKKIRTPAFPIIIWKVEIQLLLWLCPHKLYSTKFSMKQENIEFSPE